MAGEVAGNAAYFLSHSTALELHRMLTQPNLTIRVSCTRRIRPQSIGGYAYRFVLVSEAQLYGIAKHWVTKEQSVMISDTERTIIDCLRLPDLAGGITEVAKALWMKRDSLDTARLIDYALRLDVGAVSRRLGYLLERHAMANAATLRPLRDTLSATYQRLDPVLPPEGAFLSRWRLRLNVSARELDAVRLG